MFEFAIEDPHRIRLRIGRWHFRTWPSWVLKLPSGYRAPELIYSGEWLDEDDKSYGQIGAFFSEEMAEACMARLEAGGRTNLVVNAIAVHSRIQDWEWDR
ncbi:hypothetical protein ACFTSF_26485 [Kribbella sp. NPDC056951]|uniref:hypothetical protein n=1 Tax=Kribbella sp. NPDC056951 TaxID=3345978 RepID=UPI003642C203